MKLKKKILFFQNDGCLKLLLAIIFHLIHHNLNLVAITQRTRFFVYCVRKVNQTHHKYRNILEMVKQNLIFGCADIIEWNTVVICHMILFIFKNYFKLTSKNWTQNLCIDFCLFLEFPIKLLCTKIIWKNKRGEV